MKVTWLTQAGLYFKSDKISVMVDPYLSDALSECNPNMKRRVPVDESFLSVSPDVLLITHSHLDHLDPKTLEKLLASDTPITVLAPGEAYKKLTAIGGAHNYVRLDAHSVWSERGVTFYAVHAAHSDTGAVGFIIDDGEKTYYISGDTLYNFDVIDDVLDLAPDGVSYAFLPINGKGCNMHAKDASDFAYEINADRAVPLHYGLFDDVDPKSFDFDDAVILSPYEETEL